MRLDKYLADMKIGTRSTVKELIKHGDITVNNKVIKDASFKVDLNSIVRCKDEVIKYVEYEYYILNKPAGYLSATEDNKYPVVMDLIDSKRKDLSPVGRLDIDSEGLLLITNDGKLNHELLSPKKHVDKKYYVDLDKGLPNNAKELLENPMDLGDFITKEAKFEKITNTSAYLTIHEGKFHQVKRMFEKIGVNVIYLKRVEFSFLKLDDLPIGKSRILNEEEIAKLKELI